MCGEGSVRALRRLAVSSVAVIWRLFERENRATRFRPIQQFSEFTLGNAPPKWVSQGLAAEFFILDSEPLDLPPSLDQRRRRPDAGDEESASERECQPSGRGPPPDGRIALADLHRLVLPAQYDIASGSCAAHRRESGQEARAMAASTWTNRARFHRFRCIVFSDKIVEFKVHEPVLRSLP
jgi:hypothetical protein